MADEAKLAECVWMDGEFIPFEEARVHVLTHALHYGSAVFEGIRAYRTPSGPAGFRLKAHLERLANSALIYRMSYPYTVADLTEVCSELVQRNGFDACYFRPLVFRGYGTMGVHPGKCPVRVLVAAWKWGAYLGEGALERGIKAKVSTWRRPAPNTLPTAAKAAGNYLSSQLIVMEAREHDFHEGIALDHHGEVSEGSGENLFLVHRGIVYTPPLTACILPGITRDSIIRLAVDAGLDVRETQIPRDLLYHADEIFFTGTAAEVTPVTMVDTVKIGEGVRGPITTQLQSAFLNLVMGKSPDPYGWLEPL